MTLHQAFKALQAVAFASFDRLENRVQLKLLSVRASPELCEPVNLRTFVRLPDKAKPPTFGQLIGAKRKPLSDEDTL